MSISRQAKRAQERKQRKQDAKLIKKLQLSDFRFIADDKNITFSAMGAQLVDFMKVTGLSNLLQDNVDIEKRNPHANKIGTKEDENPVLRQTS